MTDSLSGPLLVIAICVGVWAAAYKSKQYEEAKFLRYIEANDCKILKRNRTTGQSIWKCNDGKEITR